MLNSKLTLLKSLILLFGLPAVLTACHLPSPEKAPGSEDLNDSSGSTFYFTSTKADFTKETVFHKKLLIPVSRELSLKVCVSDQLRSKSIVGHDFQIKGESTDLVVRTDANGCLIWQEKISFNFLNDEKNVTFRRQIIARGVQKGSRQIDFAINPWAETVFSSVDSRVKDRVDATEAEKALTGTASKKASLWVDGLRVNIMQEQIRDGKGTYKIELTGSVQGERSGMNGERRFFDLAAAEGIADVRLICAIHPQGKKPERRVLAEMKSIKGQFVNNGKFLIGSRFDLRQFCPSSGFNMIALSLRIDDQNSPIRPFEGLFHIGPVQNFGGPSFSVADGEFATRFQENRDLTVDQYMTETSQVFAANGTLGTDGSGGSELLQNLKVEVSRLEFTTTANRLSNSQKLRERLFNVTACFRLGVDQSTIRASTFEIKKLNGKTTKDAQTKSRNDGCVTFEDSITYNHFDQECWIEKDLRFKNSDFGMDQEVKVYINPWSQSGSWIIDSRYSSGSQALRCTQGSSYIMFDSYALDYTSGRFKYQIDDFLGLNYQREANLTLNPRLVRSSFSANQGSYSDPEPLPAGKYLLRYALVDQSVSDFSKMENFKDRVYSVGRALVQVREDGRITDQVRILTPNEALISLGILNQFILELVPLKTELPQNLMNVDQLENYVDSDHVIQVAPFVAQFVTRAEGGLLRRLDTWIGKSLISELDGLFTESRREMLKKNRELAKKDVHATRSNLELVNLNESTRAERFLKDLNQAGPQFRGSPILKISSVSDILTMVQTGKIDRKSVHFLCGYIFKNLWRQNLYGKSHGLIGQAQQAEQLTHACAELGTRNLSEAFDIEQKYFVKGVSIKNEKGCQSTSGTNNRCLQDKMGSPEEVLIRKFDVSAGFSLSRDFSFSEGTSFNLGLNAGVAKYVGISGGVGYSVSKSKSEGQSTSQNFSTGQGFVVESLKFRLQAQESERCLAIRLNPSLFDRKEKSLVFWEQESVFARSLHKDLSPAEKNWGQKRGFLLCEGRSMSGGFEFVESFHILRPDGETGLLGDEKSRAKVEGLFMSLRGVNDLTSFLSQIQGTGALPESFYPELQSRQLTADREKEAIRRGSRAAPGVFSSTLH